MLELDPRDAVRALAFAYDGSLVDDDHEADDLFGAGVLKSVRDCTDEYITELTPDGRDALRRLLDSLNPENRT